MRLAGDLEVSKATEKGEGKVDLLLWGHDHHVVRRFASDAEDDPTIIQQDCVNEDIVVDGEVDEAVRNIRRVKSGTDWTGLSVVRLGVRRALNGNAVLSKVHGQFTSSENYSSRRSKANSQHQGFADLFLLAAIC